MPKKKTTILVTGGAGFMGSNFIRYMLKRYKKYRIINLDKLTYAGNIANLEDIENDYRYSFIKGDICNERHVYDIIKKKQISIIINMAAESHVDRSILGPRGYVDTNVIGTLTLLEAARKYKIKRYIQVSTDEVYGEVKKGEFSETSPFDPRSPYSASKAGGDHLVNAYYTTYKLPTISLHSCNFFGPYQYPEKFIPLFITNFLERKKVPLYGSGNQVREWIYTEDFCRALDLILHKGKIGEVYNIGTGIRKKNIDIAKLLAKLTGTPNKKIVRVKDRPGHDARYAIDATKITKLGFKPEYGLLEGLQETVKWYQDNVWWWKRLKQSASFKDYYKQQYGRKV